MRFPCCNISKYFQLQLLIDTLSILAVRFLYPLEMSLKDKIATICKEMYGAVGVEYSELAEQRLAVSQLRSLILDIVYRLY